MKARNSLLWKLSSDNFPESSYLLGTIHLGGDFVPKLCEQISPLLNHVHLYFGETDLSEGFDQRHFLIPEGKSLEDLLGFRKFKRIRKSLLKSFDLDLDKMRYMRPLIIQQLIVNSILGNGGQVSLDQVMWTTAFNKGIECQGLETPKEQIQILGSLDINEQISMVCQIARRPDKSRTQTKKLLSHYIDQEIHKLYRFSATRMGASRKLMIKERNFRMAHRILTFGKKFPCFFAVGAGHLSGKNGLLHLLNHKGVKARPIKLESLHSL